MESDKYIIESVNSCNVALLIRLNTCFNAHAPLLKQLKQQFTYSVLHTTL